uniref:Phosphotransferase family protein n=1 Tax=Streptomyces sp. NBC_00148 TaxID=2903626 RepID=A0AAU1M2T2_9ACTN
MNTTAQGLDLPALRHWFERHAPEIEGPVTAELLHGGRSNLTFRLDGPAGSWVLRRPPLGGLTPSAHDMGREFRVVRALWGTDVPVARAVALCEDPDVLGVPFSVVEHVSGTVLRTRSDLERLPHEGAEACAYALVDAMASLHAVPYEEIGLGRFGRPEGYLGRQVSRWRDQWDRVATRELPDLMHLHGLLAQRLPTESAAAIVHGDVRVDNAILDPDDPGRVRALVDWEMATLGDPLADLALHLVYRDEAFEPVLGGSAASVSDRFPAPADLAERYARVSGRDLGPLDFYLGLGYFKIAVIAEGIHARYADGLTVGDGFETVGSAVPRLAAAGLAALTGRTP